MITVKSVPCSHTAQILVREMARPRVGCVPRKHHLRKSRRRTNVLSKINIDVLARVVDGFGIVLCPVALVQIDVVVPVPETSRIAAMHCAASLGLPFEEGLTKNR